MTEIAPMVRRDLVDDSAPGEELAELLTLDEVVTWLRVPRSWVYERTRKGQIPHVKLGKYLRFPRQALTEWLGAQNREGPSSTGSPLDGIDLTLSAGRSKAVRRAHASLTARRADLEGGRACAAGSRQPAASAEARLSEFR
jgi:excisionase family DNA binding protein